MALRRKIWHMAPGETRPLGVSFDSELAVGVSMAGETPVVSVWTQPSEDTFTQVATVTFANEQVNTTEQTADDGEVIAIGRGVFFLATAGTTLGTYYIRSECDADDGTHPVRGGAPYDVLIVSGPAAPA
jgi:hypothetical protein